jgi:prophage antirepressor-like protein
MIKIFQDKKIEILEINSELFFKAKDVCDVLGFKNTSDALKNHCDPNGTLWGDTVTQTRGTQRAKFISEGNLYSLVLASKNPKAKDFKFWVCSSVLVEIRKTGTYSIAKKFDAVKHTKRETQVENSKKINAINYEKKGLKTKQTASAKEVFRNIPDLKKYACALSVSDSLAQQGYDLSTTTKIAKSSLELFDNLIKLGIDVKN